MAGTNIGTVFQNLTRLIFKDKNNQQIGFSAAEGETEITLGDGLKIDGARQISVATPSLSGAIDKTDNAALVLTIEQK